MASLAPELRRNDPEPQPVIVKKITAAHHAAHHGGQWKVAYADFVTAMMAFFMLLWLISMTDEDKRRGLADYFSPTLLEMKQDSAGSSGLLGGDTISENNLLHRAASGANAQIPLSKAASSGKRNGEADHARDRRRFQQLQRMINQRMDRRVELRDLKAQVRLTETAEGLRIDLIDKADFSMFAIGTDRLVPKARDLVREVASAIASLPNPVIVRGHTDSRPYASRQEMNNWLLSTARADATRSAMLEFGLAPARVARIEGVADTQPYASDDPLDPRNRRISITLGWAPNSG